MFTEQQKVRTIARTDRALTASLDRLSEALTADPATGDQAGLQAVTAALSKVGEAWHGHRKDVQDPDGVLAQVDTKLERRPSKSL